MTIPFVIFQPPKQSHFSFHLNWILLRTSSMIIFPILVWVVLLQLTAKVFLAVNTQDREPEKNPKVPRKNSKAVYVILHKPSYISSWDYYFSQVRTSRWVRVEMWLKIFVPRTFVLHLVVYPTTNTLITLVTHNYGRCFVEVTNFRNFPMLHYERIRIPPIHDCTHVSTSITIFVFRLKY